ncbi:NAD(P)(+) transhydrogenase (Re/Si-specific) subunit beta [Dysgonomonas massiliensis]|uniref:NAD(P)(+) transhydrogenase (Re/Si-specific) subunit beta n=1 Tax=Dysgonomonas massiliensis TaxID=2040292 RepID=UPI000C792D96|nr:NAD(P)(+) transhydrogenase (Re/Si-specific) subunit beta [Dysgonomonas massiliensis]
MTATIYYILCGILSLLALVGISMMSKVKTSVRGNLLLSFCMLAGFVVTLLYYQIFEVVTIYALIIIGSIIGAYLARKVQMMQMPQTVAMLNGLGGLAGGIVGALTFIHIGVKPSLYPTFVNVTAILAVVVGMVTFVGSMVAAGKLHRILGQKPVVWKNHSLILSLSIIGSLASIAFGFIVGQDFGIISNEYFILTLGIVSGSVFGLAFSIRVGGADMPITISLLTSLAGIAAAIAGLAIGDLLVVSIGGIVGSSGLVLTQIMCRAMNRSLMAILTGKTSVSAGGAAQSKPAQPKAPAPAKVEKKEEKSLASIIKNTKRAIIVPGYGMALAQAQHQVRQLADMLEAQGADVKYAIHPVAGRMPGHMNVLLAEADVPYDKLYEMDNINDDFKDTDLVVVIGANDVLNPAARDAEGTPIYGMPVLNVDQAKNIVICNYDLNPGYAGVPNPLYEMKDKVTLLLGDAKESLNKLMREANKSESDSTETKSEGSSLSKIIKNTKRAIIVPGYGMALAQAQHQVRQLADMLEAQGADVKYAIHPVAGRMPGHMNVLLAEADVPYDKLYEMDNINDDFKDTDLVVVIGANDVLNPAARDAEGTPIYGMPVLNVDQAKNIVICNYDLNPGYAGVPNPLYEMTDKVTLLLGDAKESLNKLMQEANKSESDSAEPKSGGPSLSKIIKNTKRAIIVPGYGMALAQAQHQVRQLADMLEAQGADVKYAIHPVAGRMPGHMNVLLAEADVPYDKLYEMDNINDDFKDTDLVVVIGANDVLNPAARDAEGTPIYGMPVLNVDQAKNIVICNYDLNPGYAGVPNPLYEMTDKVTLLLGDAKESLNKLMREASKTEEEEAPKKAGADLDNVLKTAKRVIIVPGYGMALAQAQHQVRQLADMFEAKGADVKYAIHPVAGRMPGHMNVLLAEADVSYDKLYEMDNINDDFKDTDLVVVIGANDVLNPAARDAEGTPIYGMPVLNVDEAKYIVICNYDLNPGYAGVPNPLYEMTDKVTLLLGDAKESLSKLIKKL